MNVLRGDYMERIKKAFYYGGVILSFLALAGIAESITGRGDRNISIVLFIVGFLCALAGYC